MERQELQHSRQRRDARTRSANGASSLGGVFPGIGAITLCQIFTAAMTRTGEGSKITTGHRGRAGDSHSVIGRAHLQAAWLVFILLPPSFGLVRGGGRVRGSAMTTEQLRRAQQATPFRSFAVRLADGS